MTQEPKDGDFVAYVEALQRESAARLAQQHVTVLSAPPSDAKSGHFFDDKKKATERAPNLERVVDHFLRADRDQAAIKALVAAVIGAVVFLLWLARGGALSFLIAVALFAYALPRLLQAFRSIAASPSNKVLVDQVFGKSGTGR